MAKFLSNVTFNAVPKVDSGTTVKNLVTDDQLEGKQDTLTAGDNISIRDGVISASVPSVSIATSSAAGIVKPGSANSSVGGVSVNASTGVMSVPAATTTAAGAVKLASSIDDEGVASAELLKEVSSDLDERVTSVESRVDHLESFHPYIVGSLFLNGTSSSRSKGYRFIGSVNSTTGEVTIIKTGTDEDPDAGWQSGFVTAAKDSDGNISDLSWTYFADQVNLSNKTLYTRNDFDDNKVMPWAGMEYVTADQKVSDGLTITQHLVKCPKFYYSYTEDNENVAVIDGETVDQPVFIQCVSSAQFNSFEVFGVTITAGHLWSEFLTGPKDNRTEHDCIYDGCFPASIVNSSGTFENSTSGYIISSPDCLNYVSTKNALSAAVNLDTALSNFSGNYGVSTWQMFYRLKLLFRLEYNTLDSQSIAKDLGWLTNIDMYSDVPDSTSFFNKLVSSGKYSTGVASMGWTSYHSSTEVPASDAGCPFVYRYHVDPIALPSPLVSNVFSTSTGSIFYGNNVDRSQVEISSASATSDKVTGGYYDEITVSETGLTSNKNGYIISEAGYCNGEFTLAQAVGASPIDGNKFGDYAYLCRGFWLRLFYFGNYSNYGISCAYLCCGSGGFAGAGCDVCPRLSVYDL